MRVEGGVGGGTGGPTREPLLFCNKDDHGIKNGWIAESQLVCFGTLRLAETSKGCPSSTGVVQKRRLREG
jgi:hypothetical protein